MGWLYLVHPLRAIGIFVAIVLVVIIMADLDTKESKRSLDVAWAMIRCKWHCLWNMFKGHCEFVGQDESGRIHLVAAVSGSIFNSTLKHERIFYHDAQQTSSIHQRPGPGVAEETAHGSPA